MPFWTVVSELSAENIRPPVRLLNSKMQSFRAAPIVSDALAAPLPRQCRISPFPFIRQPLADLADRLRRQIGEQLSQKSSNCSSAPSTSPVNMLMRYCCVNYRVFRIIWIFRFTAYREDMAVFADNHSPSVRYTTGGINGFPNTTKGDATYW